MPDAMPPRELERLRRTLAMLGSRFPGEQAAANAAAERILANYGYELRHAEALLANGGRLPLDIDDGPDDPEGTNSRFRWHPRELALRAAIAPYCLFKTINGVRWVVGVGVGDRAEDRPSDFPQVFLEKLKAALPLPTTITEAAGEISWWSARDRQLKELLGLDEEGIGLDLPSEARMFIVEKMLASEFSANSLDEALVRARFLGASDHRHDLLPVIRDLERLRNLEASAGAGHPRRRPANGDTPARARRKAVEDLLSDPDGSYLSDREIARRVGVSPQTVGNVRRRLQAQARR